MRTMQKERNPDGKVAWFNGVLTEEEFLQTMRDEQRLVYEFHPTRIYGYY